MTTAAPVLSVDGLTFAYASQPLFTGWSHAFRPGVTWVRGDNGCGKSTLLRLLGGALEPRGGTIRFDGLDVQGDPIEYRRRVYWCGPDGPAFDHLKPAEFFAFVAGLYPAFDAELPTALVPALGLDAFLARRIDQLSTGSRKKVAVIAALAAGTDVVLLDEPLAALDRGSAAVLKRYLADAATDPDRLWIVASHEPIAGDEAPVHRLDLPARR